MWLYEHEKFELFANFALATSFTFALIVIKQSLKVAQTNAHFTTLNK